MGELVVKPHLLKTSTTKYSNFKSGEFTVQELVDKHVDCPSLLAHVNVIINGFQVDRKLWSHMRPKDVHVLIVTVPQGSDGVKDILRIVAVIGLAYLTMGVSSAFTAGYGATAGFMASSAVLIAGTLAIAAIFPPPSIGNQAINTTESATLKIGVKGNTATPGGPVTRIYGQYRVWPVYAAAPYIQTSGTKTQSIFMLFDFGYGPIDLSDLRIGETAISQFQGVDLGTPHEELFSGTELEVYTKNIVSQDLAIDMLQFTEVIRTSDLNATGVQLDFTFPRGCAYYDEFGNRLNRDVFIEVMFRETGSTPWRNFGEAGFSFSRLNTKVSTVIDAAWNSGFGLNTQPQPDNTQPYTLIELIGGIIEFAVGDSDESFVIPRPATYGFFNGSTQIDVIANRDTPAGAVFLLNNIKYTVVNAAAAGAVTLTISPPLVQDIVTNDIQYVPLNEGSEYYTYVDVGSRYYGYVLHTDPLYFVVSDKTAEPFTVQMNLNFYFAPASQYDIKIRRLTPVNLEDGLRRYFDESTWTALRTIAPQSIVEFKVPHTIVEMKITATDQLNGIVDNFSAMCHSKLNVWDGNTWSVQPTSNPAWIAYDILTGTANPYPVPASKIDLPQFLAFANWCDRTAANANEPQFKCDVVVDYSTTVSQLLQGVLSTGRGSLTLRDGLYSIIYDEQPTIPVQLITPHNSWGFSGSRSYGEEPHQLNVTFVDIDSGWQQREKVVYNDGYSDLNSTNHQDLTLFGCTRHTQAYRDGRYHLAQAILRQEQFSVTMDIENIICERGDYVKVQHDVPRVGGLPSRIKAINGNNVTTVEPFEVEIGTNAYKLTVRETDNVINSYNIVGLVDPFTVTLDDIGTSKIGDLCVYGIIDFVTDDYLVRSVTPASDLTATVDLSLLAPAVYSSDTDIIPPYTASISPELSVNAPLVTNLKAIEDIVYIDRYPHINILLTWTDPNSAISEIYEIYQLKGDKWELLVITRDKLYRAYADQGSITNQGYTLVGVNQTFKVLAVSASGKKFDLEKAMSASVIPSGDLSPPPSVANFSIDVVDKSIHMFWDTPVIEDLDGYVIKFYPNTVGATWANSIKIATVAWNENTTKVNARLGTYLIKAFDTSGNFSLLHSAALTQIPQLSGLNVVTTLQEDDTWLGVYTSMEKLGTRIQTVTRVSDPDFPDQGQEYEPLGTYEFFNSADLTEIYECRVSAYIAANGQKDNAFVSDWNPVSSISIVAGKQYEGWDAAVEVRVSSDNVVWSAWKRFNVSDITGRYLEFRIIVESLPTIQVVVYSASVIIDMPDRIESDFNINSGVTPLSILYDPAFAEIPSIGITQDNVTTGDYYVITGKTRSGFTIQFFNAASTPVDRQFDWLAKGYGRQTLSSLPPDPGGLVL